MDEEDQYQNGGEHMEPDLMPEAHSNGPVFFEDGFKVPYLMVHFRPNQRAME